MKKGFRSAVYVVVLMLVISACSASKTNSEKNNAALDDFIKAFTNEGVQVDKSKKPMFQMIGAKDGVIFYMDENPVKIYEYESTKTLQDVKSQNSIVQGMVTIEKYALETNNEKAKAIFEKVK